MFSTDEYMRRVVYTNDAGFYVYNDPSASFYEVFAPDATCAYRVASIGKNYGLQRAIDEADKRAA